MAEGQGSAEMAGRLKAGMEAANELLKELRSLAMETTAEQAALRGKCDALESNVLELMRTVKNGNGRPPLVSQVEVLASKVEEVSKENQELRESQKKQDTRIMKIMLLMSSLSAGATLGADKLMGLLGG